jgi:hypothetical protein
MPLLQLAALFPDALRSVVRNPFPYNIFRSYLTDIDGEWM